MAVGIISRLAEIAPSQIRVRIGTAGDGFAVVVCLPIRVLLSALANEVPGSLQEEWLACHFVEAQEGELEFFVARVPSSRDDGLVKQLHKPADHVNELMRPGKFVIGGRARDTPESKNKKLGEFEHMQESI